MARLLHRRPASAPVVTELIDVFWLAQEEDADGKDPQREQGDPDPGDLIDSAENPVWA